jgi:hypothetical protein
MSIHSRSVFGVSLKRILLFILFVVVAVCVYIYGVLKPANTREWEYGFEILPHFSIAGNRVTVKNLRDFTYVSGSTFQKGYFDEDYSIDSISRVWFVVSKFSGFEGVAHTYFVFDMTDRAPITVSVEARRERGENYDIVGGLFNSFELMYVWGSERDALVRRSLVNKDKVYMYPLTLPEGGAAKIFMRLAARSHDLESTPRFYNTLFSNCTNELAKTANDIKPGAIPWNISLVLPGYSARELQKLGYIKSSDPIEKLERDHYVTDFVREHYADTDLSMQLRTRLQ